jgi:hypothetical protein
MVRPLEWLVIVRDHPARPHGAVFEVLAMLALRMKWADGTGFASNATLAEDCGGGISTVQRATKWAMGAGLLERTARGHRRGDGTPSANEWRLIIPSQQVTGDRLNTASTGHPRPIETDSQQVTDDSQQVKSPSQQVTGDHPSRPITTRPTTTRPKRAGARATRPSTADIRVAEGLLLAEHYRERGE